MSGFYVDPAGMDGLYNLLHRASGDAKDVLGYTTRHCDLSFDQQGLLFLLAGPHREAYRQMTHGLERLATLTQTAATQVNLAQREYATADATAAARLDASYPGASDAARLRGTLTTGRPDLWPAVARAPFADVAEPAARLVPPNYATGIEMFKINPLADLVSPAAWVRQVSVWLFGHDPFEGWGQAFSGDWDSYIYCAAAWRIIGNALDDIGRNLIAGTADVPTVWRGNAAEAEQEYQLTLGSATCALHPLCDQYGTLYSQAAEAAKHLYSVVTGLIGKLIDVLIIINAAAAVGTATIETGVGAVAGYGVAAYYAWQAYDLYNEISTFYGNAEATFKAIAGSIAMVKAGMAVAALPDLKPYTHPGQ
ncbi:hypothetical protein GKC29_18465 [Micromonospora sp. WMMC415]|uniref:hypothetical protein n=1 Tax=Micromonospora sp. WMMC415 TaxID=2675222 RepID=UPI0012B494FF|nr:hypothetical protein [Micromonospora sp. WMMC415]QGN48614.1 hypothetical protein GKC29_18465 [Micromonospora sp. WMMC415]